MNNNKSVICIITSLVLIGCSPSHIMNKRLDVSNSYILLKQKTDERFNDSLFAHAHWGVLIKSLKTGKVLYEKNSNKMFIPASNEKIITAAASLIILGPDFTFDTYLDFDGEIKDSVLNGNLVVFSNGDPTLNENFYDEPTDVFQSWASILKVKGIKQIKGNIIGDDNAFEDYPYGDGWAIDDLEKGYAPEISALQLNENDVNLKIVPPNTSSGKVRIGPDISSGYYNTIDQTFSGDTGATNISISRSLCTNNIVISGYMKVGSPFFLRTLSISNPTLFYTTVLKETLEKNGIRITGTAKDCDDIHEWKSTSHNLKLIDLHRSLSLKDILKVMMKQSNNLYAETLTRVMGWKNTGIGSFEEGKKAVENVIKAFGIKPGSYAYMDGSGLSRYDLLSPEIIVRILEKMIKGPCRQDWYDIFSIAGIDGTLINRMKGTKAEGNVHAKTGTMSNVRGLSGYVTTADGEDVVFSFLLNGHLRTTLETEYITDNVLEMISGFNSRNP